MVTVSIIMNSKPNKNSLHPLQLKITKNRRSIRFNIGKTIKRTDWDDKRNSVYITHPNSRRLNNYLSNKVIKANKIILQLEE